MFGGSDQHHKPTSAIYKYIPETDSWDIVNNMPSAKYNCFAAVLPSEEVLIVGRSSNVDEVQTEIDNLSFSLS